MEDYLRAKGLWFYIHLASAPDEGSNPKGYWKYLEAQDQAVGEVRRHLSPELRAAATGGDARTMLVALKDAYGKPSFASRFNALQTLLGTRQNAGESVGAFIARARESLRVFKASCGDDKTYTLSSLHDELLLVSLLTGSVYPSLATSLLTQDTLSIQKVEDALKNEEQHQSGVSAAAARVYAAPAAPSFVSPRPPSSSSSSSSCTFCLKSGHSVEHCFKLQDAQRKAREEVGAPAPQYRRNRPRQRAKAAKEVETPTESAGAASLCTSSSPIAPLDSWNADTGH